MKPATCRSFVLALAALALAGAPATEARNRCATEPPPQGVVERCHGLTFWFPSGAADRFRRAYFEVSLVEWMRTCVISDRAPGLLFDARESVDQVFELIQDLPELKPVRIVPDYTPLTFSEGGRTCYGVKSVSFHVAGARGAVDLDGDIDLVAGPTSDMVKEAAAAAKQALRDPSVRGSAELSRLLSVLDQLEKYGKDFDDTWYNVQPYASGDPMNAAACYKEFRAGRQACLSDDEALHACERHLGDELVQSYHYDKVSAPRYAEILQIKAADIQRSVDHLAAIQGQDSAGAVPCPSIKDVFMPRIGELSRRHSLYAAGQY
ncbi:MAG: hypothetical protein DMF82_04880 [Acidobacteria bacterium]|nr:MAG: hypothetical protein DMF82_04880 [Acidobacteriota bacterium]